MDYLINIYTDSGIRKKTNQDSALMEIANVDGKKIAFAVVCDGMGGLEKGELASATVTKRFSSWFETELREVIAGGFSKEKLFAQWNHVVQEQGEKIRQYGLQNNLKLGTTCVVLLIMDNQYFCMNVGDSRAYKLDSALHLITKDQTLVQRELDKGRLTPQEALVHPQRNVLLQCIGASDVIVPDYFSGEVNKNDVFMMCSDGFRHEISEEEIYYYFNAGALLSEEYMKENAKYLVELNKYRQEQDNITVTLVKVI